MRNRYLLFLNLIILVACSEVKNSESVSKNFKQETVVELNSVRLNTIVSPVNWYIDRENIIMMQIQTDNFITVLDKNTFDVKEELARKGRGPSEYLAPVVVVGSPTNTIFLSQEFPQKYDAYKLLNDSVILDTSCKRALPKDDRLESVSMPKVYSYLHYVDSSRVIGSSFDGAKPEVDIVDVNKIQNLSSLDFPLDMSKSEYSAPYIFSADYYNDYFVVAYNYIDRVEAFRLVDNQLKLQYVIEGDNMQEDLLDQSKTKVNYYGGVVVDSDKLYALYYGDCSSGDYTYIEVYNLADGESIKLYKLSRKLTNLTIDRYSKKLYMIDPNETESMLFSIDI
ncbi:MAG: hypothetical protein R3Y26_08290 [Rikenellaceae bacterium]